jgi:hypothetical protein
MAFWLKRRVHWLKRWLLLSAVPGCLNSFVASGQIDPIPRELIQFGYNASFEGHAPVSAYAFYYRNLPEFYRTNLTLRLAVAPTYVDSELGISRALGEHTDLGIGVAGGGFADSYDEIRNGRFIPGESFTGHSGEASVSIYHCFNPEQLIPLNGIFRGTAHYSAYEPDNTSPAFHLPENRGTFSLRTGLRWGGKEPTLYPSLAMELSVWYEGQYRTDGGGYGFLTNGVFDRRVEAQSHLFWGQALLAYTMTNSGQCFFLSLIAGTSVDPDRFSAYRLGALLPLVSEFPLSLPGYYYQEISARQFVLVGGNYMFPLDPMRHWNLNVTAATAGVDYLPGLEQSGNWLSGVGGGVLYRGSSVKVMVGYAYGVDALRTGSRGAHSIGFLMQYDLGHARTALLNPEEPGRWRGLQQLIGAFRD